MTIPDFVGTAIILACIAGYLLCLRRHIRRWRKYEAARREEDELMDVALEEFKRGNPDLMIEWFKMPKVEPPI